MNRSIVRSLLLTVLLALAIPAAASASSWSFSPVKDVLGPDGQSAAVACASATSCIAVGDAIDPAGQARAYAQRWDGTRWRVAPPAIPSGATASSLSGVSCPAGGSTCVAVGTEVLGGSTLTLAETWSGTAWTIEMTQNPTATSDVLSAVSCTSASHCLAVGWTTSPSGPGTTTTPLAERLNGAVWSVTTSLIPDASTFTELFGVACASATTCAAVGLYGPPTPLGTLPVPLVEQWSHGTWTEQALPSLASPGSARLSAVSCPALGSCVAVGSMGTSSSIAVSLIEHQHGTTWTQQTSAATSQSIPVAPYAILADGWNGAAWSTQPATTPTGQIFNTLSGVSCTGATCVAVGQSAADGVGGALSEELNGSSWSILTIPSPARLHSELAGISCTAGPACVTVGTTDATSGAFSGLLGAKLSGASWTLTTPPLPAGAAQAALSAISCPTSSFCEAVGWQASSAYVITPLAETFNGTGWTVKAPASATGGELAGVDCTSPTSCEAVGSYDPGSSSGNRSVPLAEHWNGHAWAIQTTPTPVPDDTNELYAVSCPTASLCLAVGAAFSFPGEETIAEHLSGSTWSVTATPPITGAIGASLYGVSCTAADDCQAVGGAALPSGTVAERWDGTTWTLEATPTERLKDAQLDGVSCTVADDCVAVGAGYDEVGTPTGGGSSLDQAIALRSR